MPELRFLKTQDPNIDALEFEFTGGPPEIQRYMRALQDPPEGFELRIRKGKSAQGRPTLILGLAEKGKLIALVSAEKGFAGADAPKAAEEETEGAVQLPDVVKNANAKQLETMAARHGMFGNDPDGKKLAAFKAHPESVRRILVASAMKQTNAA